MGGWLQKQQRGKNKEFKDTPLIWIKWWCETNGCYLYNNACQEKTRICCQERLHSHCDPAGLGAPGTAGSAHWGRDSQVPDPFSSPQGSIGTCWCHPGELESSVSSNRLISALIFNWENDGPLTHHCSISHQGLRDATEEMIFLPYVSAFNLNLSVTLAHLGINVASRLLWCTQDACGLFHIPVRGWQECPHSRNPSEPKLQQPLPRHPPASAHTGQQKACRLSRELCELKSSGFWKLHLRQFFEDVIAKWEECQGDQDCPRTRDSAATSGNRHCRLRWWTRAHEIKQQICSQFRRKQSNNHVKKSHLLIPGGPSKCLSGFLKVLGSEGPTWVSRALSLPVCDWRNKWAELFRHWVMDGSFYSCISGWPVGPEMSSDCSPHRDTPGHREQLHLTH